MDFYYGIDPELLRQQQMAGSPIAGGLGGAGFGGAGYYDMFGNLHGAQQLGGGTPAMLGGGTAASPLAGTLAPLLMGLGILSRLGQRGETTGSTLGGGALQGLLLSNQFQNTNLDAEYKKAQLALQQQQAARAQAQQQAQTDYANTLPPEQKALYLANPEASTAARSRQMYPVEAKPKLLTPEEEQQRLRVFEQEQRLRQQYPTPPSTVVTLGSPIPIQDPNDPTKTVLAQPSNRGGMEILPYKPPAKEQALSVEQAKSLGFHGQMQNAENVLNELGAATAQTPTEQMGVMIAGTPARFLTPQRIQKTRQAQDQWLQSERSGT